MLLSFNTNPKTKWENEKWRIFQGYEKSYTLSRKKVKKEYKLKCKEEVQLRELEDHDMHENRIVSIHHQKILHRRYNMPEYQSDLFISLRKIDPDKKV